MRRIAVVLAGCGHRDGAEITEAVSILISLQQYGAQISCFAPTLSVPTVNHLDGHISDSEKRDVLTESARICRGKIQDITQLQTENFDAVVFSGGSGVAKNLCDWATRQSACVVHPEVKRIILQFHEDSKPIGAACIAPVLLAKVLGQRRVTLTIGSDPDVIAEVEKTGAIHELCPVDDFITDRDHKCVTTPAFMYDASYFEVFRGINAMIKEVVEMA